MEKDKKDETRTMVSYVTSNVQTLIFNYMTSSSKNIYNQYLFGYKVFNKFRDNIFGDVFYKIATSKIKDKENINNEILKKYKYYYKLYSDNLKEIKNINYHSYQYTKDNYSDKLITNNNFHEIINEIFSQMNKKLTFTSQFVYNESMNVIKTIVFTFYNKNYRNIQKQLETGNITCMDKDFVNNVKNKNHLTIYRKNINYIALIKDHFNNCDKKYWKGFTYRNILTKCIYETLGSNKDSIPADIITDIFSKAYKNIQSFFVLKKDEFKVSFPSYLDKNNKFIVPLFKNSVKKVTIKNNNYLRLTVGKYIANNYNKVINNNLICVNLNEKTHYKKYIEKSKLKKIEGKVRKKDNFIIDDKFYIEKTNKDLINAYYVFVKIPNKLVDKKINLIEIVPRFNNGYKYTINIVYDKYDKTLFKDFSKIKKSEIGNDLFSADLGIVNLFSIYDPTGETIIIKGSGLTYINNYFNKIIDALKSKLKEGIYTSNIIRDMLIQRENKLNNEMNKIVWYIANRYSHKKEMVVGYNPSWKNKVQLGKKVNRKFYEIPYREILKKLELALKVKNIKLTITEESYTSICDALSLEEIGKHDNYMGKRVLRGLFSSKQGLLVNADVNGALNILRKVYPWIKKFNKKLLNPIRIKLTSEDLSSWCRQKGGLLQKIIITI